MTNRNILLNPRKVAVLWDNNEERRTHGKLNETWHVIPAAIATAIMSLWRVN